MTVPSRVPGPAPVPRQLPAPPRLFAGRERELAQLTKTLDEQVGSGATLVISAIGGAGGIGKTWLALRWAYQHADRFPDGQLYVNLRGFDPSGEPLPAQTAVRGFLHALGVESAAIPVEPDAQVGLYRSLLTDKHMLVVLDNARDAAQVTPLLPGSATCTVLVTSRWRLTALVVAHGAQALDLDVLSEAEARQLMIRHLGPARAAAEPDAVTALLEYCAGLPLAISILTARAIISPSMPLSAIAEELTGTSSRLDALTTGDLSANLRAALSWTYEALAPDAARALSLLALAPGPDIDVHAAAGLLALTVADTRVLLRHLEDAYLIHRHRPDRHRMHDLVRLFATERAERDHTPSERDAARRRVLDFYVHTAGNADRVLNPHRPHVRLDPPLPGVHPHELSDDSAAMAWFEAEHLNLLGAQTSAAVRHWHAGVWHLAWALSSFHLRRGYRHENLATWQAALEAAEYLSDPATLPRTHRVLGRAYADLGRHEEAAAHLHRALDLAQHHGDRAEEVQIHRQIAWAWEQRGDYRQALDHATQALELCRALDQPVWEASALNSAGWHAAHLGDYDTARSYCRAALTVHHDHGNRQGEAETLDSLGYIEQHSGHLALAVALYEEALVRYRAVGDTSDYANTLDNLAHCHNALGRRQQARAVWQEALELYRAHQRDADAERVRQQIAALLPGPDPTGNEAGPAI